MEKGTHRGTGNLAAQVSAEADAHPEGRFRFAALLQRRVRELVHEESKPLVDARPGLSPIEVALREYRAGLISLQADPEATPWCRVEEDPPPHLLRQGDDRRVRARVPSADEV